MALIFLILYFMTGNGVFLALAFFWWFVLED